MKRWWRRNKNRISCLVVALVVCLSSLFTTLTVNAQSDASANSVGSVISDTNGDGQISFDEINIVQALSCGLSLWGYFGNYAIGELVENSTVIQEWCTNASDDILAYLGDDGLVTFSNEMWQGVRLVANALLGKDGYTSYPALPSSKIAWLSIAGVSLNDTAFNSYIGNTADFPIGMPVSVSGSTYYFTNCKSNYYDYIDDGNMFFIKYGGNVCAYYKSGLQYYQLYINTSSNYVTRSYLSPNDGYKTSNWTTAKYSLAPIDIFYGLVGMSCMVFDSASAAAAYYNYERNVYVNSHGGAGGSIPLSVLNSNDWESVNMQAYAQIKDSISSANSDGALSNSQAQQIIDDYAEEILENLDALVSDSTERIGLLQKIYNLLDKWLPKVGSSGGDTNINVDLDGETEQPSVDKFGSDSSDQSSSLSDLNEQTQVDKPNVDDMSSQIDENLDIEIDSNYGSVLASLTSNSNILTMLIVSVSVALISYILFGKK